MSESMTPMFNWMLLMDWVALLVFLLAFCGYTGFRETHSIWTDRHLRADLHRDLLKALCRNADQQEGRRFLAGTFQTYGRTITFFDMVSFLAMSAGLGLFLSPKRTEELLSFSWFHRIESLAAVRFRIHVFIFLSGYAFLQIIWGLKALFNLTYSIHHPDPDVIDLCLNHLDIDGTHGVRTLYYLVVLFPWLFGPEFLLVGLLLLTYLLYRYDFLIHRPDENITG